MQAQIAVIQRELEVHARLLDLPLRVAPSKGAASPPLRLTPDSPPHQKCAHQDSNSVATAAALAAVSSAARSARQAAGAAGSQEEGWFRVAAWSIPQLAPDVPLPQASSAHAASKGSSVSPVALTVRKVPHAADSCSITLPRPAAAPQLHETKSGSAAAVAAGLSRNQRRRQRTHAVQAAAAPPPPCEASIATSRGSAATSRLQPPLAPQAAATARLPLQPAAVPQLQHVHAGEHAAAQATTPSTDGQRPQTPDHPAVIAGTQGSNLPRKPTQQPPVHIPWEHHTHIPPARHASQGAQRHVTRSQSPCALSDLPSQISESSYSDLHAHHCTHAHLAHSSRHHTTGTVPDGTSANTATSAHRVEQPGCHYAMQPMQPPRVPLGALLDAASECSSVGLGAVPLLTNLPPPPPARRERSDCTSHPAYAVAPPQSIFIPVNKGAVAGHKSSSGAIRIGALMHAPEPPPHTIEVSEGAGNASEALLADAQRCSDVPAACSDLQHAQAGALGAQRVDSPAPGRAPTLRRRLQRSRRYRQASALLCEHSASRKLRGAAGGLRTGGRSSSSRSFRHVGCLPGSLKQSRQGTFRRMRIWPQSSDSDGQPKRERGRALAQRLWPSFCGAGHLGGARYSNCELKAAA